MDLSPAEFAQRVVKVKGFPRTHAPSICLLINGLSKFYLGSVESCSLQSLLIVYEITWRLSIKMKCVNHVSI